MNRRPRKISIILLLLVAGIARADPTPEQLKALYEESQKQLQQSQDRKNQLANENEQLRARVEQLEGDLRILTFQVKQGEFLRNQYALWVTFMKQYPLLLKRFDTYLSGGATDQGSSLPQIAPRPDFFDPQWPFSAAAGIRDES